MPQRKGCVPWNKGLTKETDERVKNYTEKNKRKIVFSTKEINNIIYLYVKKEKDIKTISNLYKCSVSPIKRILKENKIKIKSISEYKISEGRRNREVNKRNFIVLNNRKYKLRNGFFNKKTKDINCGATVILKCPICNNQFERMYFYVKKYIKLYKRNYCPFCATRSGSNPKTSSQQRLIHSKIKGKINYLIDNIYVDICFPKSKIIVEYDGIYWHKNKLIKDRRRDEYLKRKGYKILRIKSRRLIPKITEIKKQIKFLKNTNYTYREIILPDWEENK